MAQLYPRHRVSFRRLLRLAGLRWRYSNSPPHGRLSHSSNYLAYNICTDRTENSVPLLLFPIVAVQNAGFFRGRCPATGLLATVS
jgi:hypothetical protein